MTDRVVHITLYKCGSQWVRDVLTAQEIARCSRVPYSGITLDFASNRHLDLPSRAFNGPIYTMNQWEWRAWKRAGDRAVVVLRDPRDLAISYLFSNLYSHQTTATSNFLRSLLPELPRTSAHVRLLAGLIGAFQRTYLTWTDVLDGDAILVRYEDLLSDELAEFRRIIQWLGWEIPDQTLRTVVARLSFETRSGRARGDTDVFSHYRRGVAGDWRNYFIRDDGEFWENQFPGFLRAIGYEADDNWWRSLPQQPSTSALQAGALGTEVRALQSRNAMLEKELLEKEYEIRALAKTCEERLDAIHALEKKLLRERGC